jgi:hypothetical protein
MQYLLWTFFLLGLAETFGVAPVLVLGRQIRVALTILLFSKRGSDNDNDAGSKGKTVTAWYSFHSYVYLSDVDMWGHMNNCKYYERCENGRFEMLMRSGLHDYMASKKYHAGLAGCLLRFRRELRPLQKFHVCTRIVGWDSRSFFFEHRSNSQIL